MVLEVKNLQTHFFTPKGLVRAVDKVSFSLEPGKVLGLVGESGCGKSMTGLSLLGLVDPPGKIVGGEILLNGKNLSKLSEIEMEQIRGKEIAMIFQDPLSSLNPILTIGRQITETILSHTSGTKGQAWEQSITWLRRLGLPHPEKIMKYYPFQLSGGMRQRVMIATALALQPQVLIADEPTTALDLTVQAQIIEEIKLLQKENSSAVIFITHDLGVVAELADQVAVMYAGSLVEYGEIEQIFDYPRHPYTQALLDSRMNLGERQVRFIPGLPPNLLELPVNQCAFAPRCPRASQLCWKKKPTLLPVSTNQQVACHLSDSQERSKKNAIIGA